MYLKNTLQFFKKALKPRLDLLAGTRAASFLFIFLALLVATGALFAANTYYDLGTGEVITEEVQRITQLTRATGGLIAGGGASDTLAGGVKLQVSGGSLRVGDGNFTVATTGNTYVGGTTTFATSVEVQGTLDPNYMAAYTLSGDITGTSSPNITGIGTFSGATATLASVVQSPEFTATSGTTTIGSAGDRPIVLDPDSGEIKIATGTLETPGGHSIRAPGEQVLQGMESVLGFDYPVRCSSACDTNATTISRTVTDYPFSPAMEGTTRVHKFVIHYADTIASGSSTWIFKEGTKNATFTVPAMSLGSTDQLSEQGQTYITPKISSLTDNFADGEFPTTTSWYIKMKTATTSGATIQVNQIDLAAYDEID